MRVGVVIADAASAISTFWLHWWYLEVSHLFHIASLINLYIQVCNVPAIITQIFTRYISRQPTTRENKLRNNGTSLVNQRKQRSSMDVAAPVPAPTRGKGPRIYQKHSHRDAKGWKKMWMTSQGFALYPLVKELYWKI